MAAGNTLLIFHPYNNEPPASNFATLDMRNLHPCLDFDAATNESAVFSGVMPQHYAGGGVSCRIWWGAATATTADTVWTMAFRAIEDDADDIDASHTYDFNTVTDTAPSASGEFTAAVITFTNGAAMDNVGAGDLFLLRITRNADDGADSMSGDAQLMAVEIRET